jgi:DNA polymerase II large subunit
LGIFSSTYKFKRGKYTEYKLVIRGENVLLFDKVSFISDRKKRALKRIIRDMRIKPQMKYKEHRLVKVKEVEYVKVRNNEVYSLSAKHYHNIIVNEYILTSNCDGDEDSVFLLMDAFLNFSKYFLPSTRGGKMDAPLVLTTVLDPREVDEESHNMDIVSRYPLEFYEATLRYAKPQEVEDIIETVSKRIGSEKQYYGFSFTHDHGDINKAIEYFLEYSISLF